MFAPEIIEQLVELFINEYSNFDQIKKIIILPNLNLRNADTYVFSDYVTTTSLYGLAKSCIYSEINPLKVELYKMIDYYLHNEVAFQQLLDFENSDGYADYKICTSILDNINKIGLNNFLANSQGYILDDNDTRTIEDFLE